MLHLGKEANLSQFELLPIVEPSKEQLKTYKKHKQDPAIYIKPQIEYNFHALDSAFFEGANVNTLIALRAKCVDELIRFGWQWFLSKRPEPIALIAVGGYGRGKMHPGSDIDILILTDKATSTLTSRKIEQFIGYLWNFGLNVGHSVRHLKECLALAKDDITIFSNLIDMRLVIGDEGLFHKLNKKIFDPQFKSIALFYKEKLQEQKERYKHYQNTEYNLEPNIKESPGGLRDLQLFLNLVKLQYGTDSFNQLNETYFLELNEREALIRIEYILNQIRYALHLVCEKPQDRLFIDHQIEIAKHFGFTPNNINQGITQFMQAYFKNAAELRELTHILVQQFYELHIQKLQSPQITSLNDYCYIKEDVIEISDQEVFKRHPYSLLTLFEFAATNKSIKGFSAKTARFVRYLSRRLSVNDLKQPIVKNALMNIINSHESAFKGLELLNRYSVLKQLIPLFEFIGGQMQYDLYHIYTVDAHTLLVVRNICRFGQAKYAEKFPLSAENLPLIPHFRVLVLAALFHDIGKGQGGNHSEIGEKVARQFAEDIELDQDESDLICFLVANHLLMSSTAQKKDIHDPQVIEQFAEIIQTKERLRYLYLLTVADICATNPQLWNSWLDALLKKCFEATYQWMDKQSHLTSMHQKDIHVRQEQALSLIEKQTPDVLSKVQDIWAQIGKNYFMHETADNIAWHTPLIIQARESGTPVVECKAHSTLGATEIFIFAQDKPHLFASIASSFDKLNLSIVAAKISTTYDGFCLNTFLVLESSGQPITGPNRLNEIIAAIKALVAPEFTLKSYKKLPIMTHRMKRFFKHFKGVVEVKITNGPQGRKTIVELTSPDYPGLLARVGQAFVESDVFLHHAKINTLGNHVEDVFSITTRTPSHQQLNETQIADLKSTLLKYTSANCY